MFYKKRIIIIKVKDNNFKIITYSWYLWFTFVNYFYLYTENIYTYYLPRIICVYPLNIWCSKNKRGIKNIVFVFNIRSNFVRLTRIGGAFSQNLFLFFSQRSKHQRLIEKFIVCRSNIHYYLLNIWCYRSEFRDVFFLLYWSISARLN